MNFPAVNSRIHLLEIPACARKLQIRSTGSPTLAGNQNFDCGHCRAKWVPQIFMENQERMLSAAYDILKKDAAELVWLEAAHDLETAKSRVKEIAARSDGEYVIFDQRTRRIVASFNASKAQL